MLEKKKRRKDYSSSNSIIADVKENAILADASSPSPEEVLGYMMGDRDDYMCAGYVVYHYDKEMGRTFIQRLNMLWVYPLFFLSIPFQFLLTGSWGVSRNSKIGKVIDWLVKF